MPVKRLVLVALLASQALADDVTNARALLQQGVELYRAGKYDDAIPALQRSYELDPKLETLYSLAQAERLGGHCPDAIVHYNKILDAAPEPSLAAAVKNNMGLCVVAKDRDKHDSTTSTPVAVVQPAPPKPATMNPVLVSLLGGGGLLLGASLGLLVAASDNQAQAGAATTFGEYDRLTRRAGLERGLGYTFATLGAAAIGGSVYLIMRKESPPPVSATVTSQGAAVFVQGRW
jgi:tetratricopeptide (TPR) repeat protein